MISTISKQTNQEERIEKEMDHEWVVAVSKLKNNDELVDLISIEPKDARYQDLAYASLIPMICILMSAGFTLIPQHNILEEPEYWYEIAVPLTMSWMFGLIVLTLLRFKIFFKEIPSLTSAKTITKIILENILLMELMILLTHLVWTDHLGYTYPIPWLCLIILIPFGMTFNGIIWYAFPIQYRKDQQYRKKIIGFIGYTGHFANACGERLLLIWLFSVTPLNLQPIWAVLLPAWREFDDWILRKLQDNVTDGKNRDGTLFTSIEHKCNYAVFLSVVLGLYSTSTSSYWVLAIDNLLKFYQCYKIINENIRIKSEIASRGTQEQNDVVQDQIENNEAIQDLVLDEFVEILMPIVYFGLVLMGYYGPNSEILGNIGAERWTWKKIGNMKTFASALFRMFFIDLIALALNTVLLWKYCSVNAIKVLCHLIRKYWPLITVTLGGGIVKVCSDFMIFINVLENQNLKILNNTTTIKTRNFFFST